MRYLIDINTEIGEIRAEILEQQLQKAIDRVTRGTVCVKTIQTDGGKDDEANQYMEE